MSTNDSDVYWAWINEYQARLLTVIVAFETILRDTEDRKRSILAATLRHLADNLPRLDGLENTLSQSHTSPEAFANRHRQLLAELADQIGPGSQSNLVQDFFVPSR